MGFFCFSTIKCKALLVKVTYLGYYVYRSATVLIFHNSLAATVGVFNHTIEGLVVRVYFMANFEFLEYPHRYRYLVGIGLGLFEDKPS